MSARFSLPVRVYYEDTDSGGVVYYANYLRFMERARTEWLRTLGVEQDELSRQENVIFAVRWAKVDYLRPARFNEELDVTVDLGRRGKASLTFSQEVRRAGDVVCTGEIKVACLHSVSFIPVPMPIHIVTRIDAWSLA
jgi:acyl-CoA thioester hydrolase